MAADYLIDEVSGIEFVRYRRQACRFPQHVHRHHLILGFLSEGAASLWLGERRWALSAPCLFVIFPGQAHALDISTQSALDMVCFAAEPSQEAPLSPVIALRDRLRDCPAESFPLDAMVRKALCDRWRLLRSFKKLTGMTPHAYQIACRVSLARRLLREGVAIAEAALVAGFADQSHFSRWFKRHSRLTPRQFLAKSLKARRGRIRR